MSLAPLAGWMAVCVLVEGLFAATEMALLSANRHRLQVRANEGERGAIRAIGFLEREDRLIATCLVGTNLALVAGSTLAVAAWLTGTPAGLALALSFVPAALVLGEAAPKMLSAAHADSFAPVMAYPLRFFELLFTPILSVIALWSGIFRRITPPSRPVRREEIVQMMADRSSKIDPEDRRIIQRAIGLSEIPVESSMTPLVDLTALPETALVSEAIRLVATDSWSRIPVYRDRVDNLVGVIEHRDLLFAKDDESIASLVRPVRFVPESKRVDELLRELRQDGEHLAVVVDEYGGSVGIVTLADLLENLLGDIRDERDEDESLVKRISDREWRLAGRASIEEVTAAAGRRLPEGDYETVAGLILQVMGRIPKVGEVIKVGRCLLTIEEATERSIVSVKLTTPAETAPL